ncbi:MAG: hypothetical protein HRT47_09310 [Candidatus Caenarcaniphilales bacterium]|nr:hypothetical protein [Candidatus Caenarcaniphilales bacterium]
MPLFVLIFFLGLFNNASVLVAKEFAPIRLSDDSEVEESLILAKPEIDNSNTEKKQKKEKQFNGLGLKKNVGVLDTEFKLAPLQRQAQLGANIDLIKVTELRRKEKYLRLQCRTNPDRCDELNQFLLEKKHKNEIMPQIQSIYQNLKKAPAFLYSTIQKEFQSVEDHDQ